MSLITWNMIAGATWAREEMSQLLCATGPPRYMHVEPIASPPLLPLLLLLLVLLLPRPDDGGGEWWRPWPVEFDRALWCDDYDGQSPDVRWWQRQHGPRAGRRHRGHRETDIRPRGGHIPDVEGPRPGTQRDPHVPPRLVCRGRQVRLRAHAAAQVTGGLVVGRGAQAAGRPEHQQPGTAGKQVRGGGQGALGGGPAVALAVAQAVRLVHPVCAAEVRAEGVVRSRAAAARR